MKKRLSLVAVLAALVALTFVGCGITSTNILGEWEGEGTAFFTTNGQTVSVKCKIFLNFSKGGTGKVWTEHDGEADEEKGDFKWELSTSELTIIFLDENDEFKVTTDDIKDNPDKFEIKIPKEFSGTDQDMTIRFYKNS